jgi:hypothetical protein
MLYFHGRIARTPRYGAVLTSCRCSRFRGFYLASALWIGSLLSMLCADQHETTAGGLHSASISLALRCAGTVEPAKPHSMNTEVSRKPVLQEYGNCL